MVSCHHLHRTVSVDKIGFVYFFLSLCYTHTIHDRNEWSASFGKQTIVHFLIFFFYYLFRIIFLLALYLIITWKVKYKTYFLNVHILDGFLLVPTQARVRFYFCLPLLNSYVKPFWLFFFSYYYYLSLRIFFYDYYSYLSITLYLQFNAVMFFYFTLVLNKFST